MEICEGVGGVEGFVGNLAHAGLTDQGLGQAVAVMHTVTTRPTTAERRTVQIYYGHRNRAPLANDSSIPGAFWRDSGDEETRGFYGVLNERTKLYMAAFLGVQ